ncbi:MAG: multidrug effflux MFS transporter [Burkholderiaceae bacterium]
MQPPLSRSYRAPPLWLLALITFSGTLGMHIFVPALPFAGKDLGASIAEMQLTVSLYILGLAFGQLIYGPLSDRFGRRSTLMIGLTLYTLSGLAAALAPQVHALIAARLFQALGGCAGMVLGRAIVRDTAGADQSARRLALLSLVTSVGPGTAPMVGGLLASTLGWRSIFYLLCLLGVVNLLCCWKLLPETRQDASSTDVRALARNYGLLLRSPAFLGYAIGGSCSTTAGYAFIAAAPFVFVNQLHRPAYEVGLYLGILVAGASVGAGISSRLIGRVSLTHLLVRANLVSVAATLVYLAAVLSGHLSTGWIVGPLFIYMMGSGMGSPASATKAISVNPKVIGSASGLYGFTQMLIGALCTALVGLGHDPALAAAVILCTTAIIGQLAYGVANRHARNAEAF